MKWKRGRRLLYLFYKDMNGETEDNLSILVKLKSENISVLLDPDEV